jgi:hypothetical protein
MVIFIIGYLAMESGLGPAVGHVSGLRVDKQSLNCLESSMPPCMCVEPPVSNYKNL